MKKKKSGKRIFAIVLLVVIGIGGFYFGYDIGRMDHDEERIRAELKKTTADSEISIRPVAKGGTGKTEIEILTECLEDAKDSLENLEKYNEQLQALDGKTPDTETVVLIQDLDDKNEKAYEVLKDLTEDPAGYIAEKAAARGEGDEVWADDWAADIQVVKWLKENDGKRLYKVDDKGNDFFKQLACNSRTGSLDTLLCKIPQRRERFIFECDHLAGGLHHAVINILAGFLSRLGCRYQTARHLIL